MGPHIDRPLLRRALQALVMGNLLLIFASLTTAVWKNTAAVSVMLGFSMSYVFVQLTALRIAVRATGEPAYQTGMYVSCINALCWLLTLGGVTLYGFVQILSTLCDVALVHYICQGTNRLLQDAGQSKLPVLGGMIWKCYLVGGVGSVGFLLQVLPIPQAGYYAFASLVLLTLIAFVVYLYRANNWLTQEREALAPPEDDQY